MKKWVLFLIILNCFNGMFFQGDFYKNIFSEEHMSSGRTQDLAYLLERDWDFIVIGAGSAGAIVANRLSEVNNWNVLLLEAGREEVFVSEIPALSGYMQYTDFNWGYSTVPQEFACYLAKNNQCPQPRGKGLGGTSIINYMIYTRCEPDDIKNEFWSFDKLLPYYIKNEKFAFPGFENSTIHGRSGPIPVEKIPWESMLIERFLKAGEELGYRTRIDYNEPANRIGFGYIQSTQTRGRRISTAKGYLNSPTVLSRRNLAIVPNARVTKIILETNNELNNQDFQATGVFVTYRKREYYIKAKKEVILSAGAMNSPQLLMLSGIGPRDHLTSLDIPVMIDLPVGSTFIDHPGVLGPMFIIDKNVSLTLDILNFPNILNFLNGFGPLTSSGGVEGIAYFRTKFAKDHRPDIELMFVAGTIAIDEYQPRNWGINKETLDEYFGELNGRHGFTLLPMMQHPKSKGTLRLKSKNPWHWPLIDPKLLSDPFDVATLVEGIKIGIQIGQSKAFEEFNPKLYTGNLPACQIYEYLSDEFWGCYVRHMTAWWHHQVGVCAMGEVVNEQLQVKHVSNLRVIDSSVLNEPPTCHTHAISMVIGERGADLVKKAWS